MDKIIFSSGSFQKQLNIAHTWRYTEKPMPHFRDGFVLCDVNKEHSEGFDNFALISKAGYSAPVSASLTCDFEGCGCPEIIIVPEPERDSDGDVRYGACFEVVLYRDGLNIWRHYRENGECSWHKRLGAVFSVPEGVKHVLEVTVKDGYIDVSVDGISFSLRTEDLPDRFSIGFAACEGVVRLYEATISSGEYNSKKPDKELELMGAFFDKRLDGYDAHMLRDIELSEHFYPYTARLLPMSEGARVLDLGCGTGLELEEYFKLNPTAKVFGIDLAPGMLTELKRKLGKYDITTVLGSYFDEPFGVGVFDAAVSVESLHHYTKKAKTELYSKLYGALKQHGYFILTDYLIDSEEEEEAHFAEYNRLRGLQGKHDGKFYHFDTPLTVEHECEALRDAGFREVEVVRVYGNTKTIRAVK